ncbi:Pyruvate/Phosphoenolpyruvate kinase [Penicillium cf. griseofulvum]|uniref:Pyruvate/Phosphoenolpyruvate kinase n=1 Tax=Penicillium cf. griseofulvum TaxID=2972120 RepID=A0A9W9LYG0_9EURO|nr:Pyruvate/Phosphoenolpyruvate kinase [Penicillium cf. griseofulvum]KAJ5443012.1 Pyruvate/Phosphoenolpyruvate kinase [Penicillium cf. griseofulvum]KAJ5451668.1 Pyruvate/Phosphoenolpyruvate kinase [Penicillium cf. griseofulvum]
MSSITLCSALETTPVAYGFWLTLPSAPVAKTILRRSPEFTEGGFSWVLVDAEHGLITDTHYYELTNAVGHEGASPIIRVPWPEEWMIKRALDAGAHGIMTPMCHSAEDAAKVVSYCKYPPVGVRGYGPMFTPHSFPGLKPAEYDEKTHDEVMVIVQIESRPGVENVEEIAKVDGLDVLFIGPFDLAKQMRVTRGGEEHEAAIQRVLNAAKSAGKKAAIFCSNGDDALRRAQQGFDMVSITTDVAVFGDGMLNELEKAKGSLKVQGKRDGY